MPPHPTFGGFGIMRGMRIFAMMMLCPAVALCADKPLPMAYDVAVIGGGAAGIAGEALELMDNVLKEAPEEERKVIEKVCDRYEIFRTDGQALVLLEQFKRAGGADDENGITEKVTARAVAFSSD